MAATRWVTDKTRIFQLKIQLRQVRPPVWRRVLVPGEITLAELHDVIQTAMGWSDSHLHEFEVDGTRYGVPDPDWGFDEVADESRVKLIRVTQQGAQLRYAYDFGDGWEHDVSVEKVLGRQPGSRYPCCVAGRRACPPEDVGGPWGYQDFLAAVSNPGHAEHGQSVEWVGGSFDPAEFHLEDVNEALEAFAWAERPIRPMR